MERALAIHNGPKSTELRHCAIFFHYVGKKSYLCSLKNIQIMNAITIYPTSVAQRNLLIALAKEMKMLFTTDDRKAEFISSLTEAAKEAKRIASGEEPAETLDDLLAQA